MKLQKLEDKYKVIADAMSEQDTFFVDDIAVLFPDMARSTVYWMLSKMASKGYLNRVRKGMYAINTWKGRKSISISDKAEKIRELLDEEGFGYYISGLDILSKYMQHVPEQYPIILFIEKDARMEIEGTLLAHDIMPCAPGQLGTTLENAIYAGKDSDIVAVYETNNFDYSDDGIASIEKAFVDTYYSVTRNNYPLSLQELVRIYENLTRLGNIDQKKMITIAARRSIQYDIRYIVESKHITESAEKFVKLMKKGN